MKLSEKITIIRKARGYSQEELGYKLMKRNPDGVSRQAVSDWETGKCEPVLDNIRDLVDVLGVSYNALLDETIDLNDRSTLNSVLKNLSPETKGKINNSHRYRIYAYTVTKKDYFKIIIYFVLLALFIAGFFILLPYKDNLIGLLSLIFFGVGSLVGLGCLSLPISLIKKIRRGGNLTSFGTLSETHFVIIGWSDSIFDRTIYVPIVEIESMELDKEAIKKNGKVKHGKVIVNIKDRNKPIITSDILYPQKLIDVFNNWETFTESPYERN